jgi:hypothetical protein
MANTKSVTDKSERKKLKRASRKKAAPKGPRTGARGENKDSKVFFIPTGRASAPPVAFAVTKT